MARHIGVVGLVATSVRRSISLCIPASFLELYSKQRSLGSDVLGRFHVVTVDYADSTATFRRGGTAEMGLEKGETERVGNPKLLAHWRYLAGEAGSPEQAGPARP
jgi:hypothetical protein